MSTNILQAPSTNPLLVGHMIAHPHQPTYSPSNISLNPAWRTTLVHMLIVSSFPDSSPQALVDAVYADITHNKTATLRDLSPDTGAYFNEADLHEVNWQQSFWGANYAKLRRIKHKYDPGDVLWCRGCVGSEAWEERRDRDGGLCKIEGSGKDEL
jgi:hypothetical protein